MKNRQSNIIDVDLDKYVVYLHKPSDTLIAINCSETERFHQLIGDNDGIENIPDQETVDGIRFQYNAKKNAYDIQTNKTHNIHIKDLDYTWIQFRYSR
jgi:hypothetical protein